MTLTLGVDGRVLTDRYHGIGRVAYALISEISEMPYVRVVVFTGRTGSRRFSLRGLNVTIVPTGMNTIDPRQLWRWPRLLRTAGVDVMFFPYHLCASPFPSRPSLALVHDCILETNPAYSPSRATAAAYRALTWLITRNLTIATVSAASAAELARYYKIRISPQNIIPNGAQLPPATPPSPAPASPAPAAPTPHPTYPDLTPDKGYILHVGAQRPHKNVPLLVEAIARVPGARLVLVGSADERFPDLVGPAIERLGVRERVTRLAFVPEGRLAELYANAALLAYPSRVEGFGLPVLEAMLAGTPVICGDVPVLREVGGAAALYAPVDDPGEWARTIARLLDDGFLRDDLARAGAAHAAEFTWAAAAQKLVSACRRQVGSAADDVVRA